MNTPTIDKNKSSPIETTQLDTSTLQSSSQLPLQSINIVISGSPYCAFKDNLSTNGDSCGNRSVPGSSYCGPHGGRLTLRNDNTLGIIGPGCYRAIASLSGLNHRYVSQVLQGKSNPTSNVLDKIAKVVGVDVSWLVEYINDQKN